MNIAKKRELRHDLQDHGWDKDDSIKGLGYFSVVPGTAPLSGLGSVVVGSTGIAEKSPGTFSGAFFFAFQ